MAASLNRECDILVSKERKCVKKCVMCNEASVYSDNKCLVCHIIEKISEIKAKNKEKQYQDTACIPTTSYNSNMDTSYEPGYCYCEKRAHKGITCVKCRTVFHFQCANATAKWKIWMCAKCDENVLNIKLTKDCKNEIIIALIDEIQTLKCKCN